MTGCTGSRTQRAIKGHRGLPGVSVTLVLRSVFCARPARPCAGPHQQREDRDAVGGARGSSVRCAPPRRAAASPGSATACRWSPAPRQMCCFDTISDTSFSGGMCRLESGGGVSMNTGDMRDRNGLRVTLEPATEFLVLARLEGGSVSRVRTFTPDCDIDATAMPLVWLTDVKPDESIAWLASLVAAAPDSGDASRSRRQDGDERHRAAQRACGRPRARRLRRADASPEWLRAETAFWLGRRAASRARACWRG